MLNKTQKISGVLLLLAAFAASANVEVIPAVHFDVSGPLSRVSPLASDSSQTPRVIPLLRLPLPSGTSALSKLDSAIQSTAGPLVSVTAGINIDGVGRGFSGPQGTFAVSVAPPDTNGAVGATQYVQWVNTSFAVFNKATGAVTFGPVTGNTLWAGFGGPCETRNDGDITVQYDKIANRWVMSQFAIPGSISPFTGGFLQCFAVSTSSDATGSYYRYAFSMPNFNDYPKIAIWPDAYYASFNMFNAAGTAFLGARACAFDRSNMLIGAAATAQCFQQGTQVAGLLPSDFDGTRRPPAGAPNYFVNFGANSLNIWSFHVDFGAPASSTFSGPTVVPVAAFSPACGGGTCIPQLGTPQQLDSLADRLMHRVAYRNFGTHESLVLNHSVAAGATVGVRWYELRSPRTTPTVFQQGTYAPADGTFRWMGSIGMDSAGNIAMGYSASSTGASPSIRYTGRVPTDTLGIMQSENTIIAGGGSQIGGLSRWGDYSSISIDPVDDCTFWYTTEYLHNSGVFNWSTRIATFKFPSCVPTNRSYLVPIVDFILN
ncbi:MAG: hypothetical protein IPJ21_16145 [Sterolibacteriaceae bacterium]|nr:hypothetical protein [Sterolibacteriaceae bacterium]MBK9085304.1 hypothetical protein [Sterolibacteriaceae bacterium]